MSDLEWMRRVRPMPPAHELIDDEIPEFDDSREHVKGPPLYQRGSFAVIDVVKDLEYIVVDARTMQQVRGPIRLDLGEARRVADDMALADYDPAWSPDA